MHILGCQHTGPCYDTHGLVVPWVMVAGNAQMMTAQTYLLLDLEQKLFGSLQHKRQMSAAFQEAFSYLPGTGDFKWKKVLTFTMTGKSLINL